jgi:hypothetical protein
MLKRITYRGQDERGNIFVEAFKPGGGGLVKTASVVVPEVQHFISTLQPVEGKTFILVTALGAFEYWGANINGDGFPWDALIHEPPGWAAVKNEPLVVRRRVAREYCATRGYGYTTFYGAHPFVHHVNYDFFAKTNRHPSPRQLGEVVFAAPNPQMRRIELVSCIDHALAERHGGSDFLRRIELGEYPDVSMGTKVPFDICSICGNVAKTRAQYCEHLNNMMNQVLPDGRKVYAINTRPRFFDISFVLLGADRTGRVMGKVASVNRVFFDMGRLSTDIAVAEHDHEIMPHVEYLEKTAAAGTARWLGRGVSLLGEGYREEKEARAKGDDTALQRWQRARRLQRRLEKRSSLGKAGVVRKQAVISKPGPQSPEMRLNQGLAIRQLNSKEPRLSKKTLDALGMSQDAGFATPSMMGILLKPHEFQRMHLVRRNLGHLADRFDSAGQVFGPTDKVVHADPIRAGAFSEILRNLLLPMMAQRSAMGPSLGKRIKMIRITICTPEKEPTPVHNELLDKISAAYNGYRLEMLKAASLWPAMAERDPEIREAVHEGDVLDLFVDNEMAKAASAFDTPEQHLYLRGSYGWVPPMLEGCSSPEEGFRFQTATPQT